jgi:hypothetical protein
MPELCPTGLVVTKRAAHYFAPAACMELGDASAEELVAVDPATGGVAADVAEREADVVVVLALVSYAFYFAVRAVAGCVRKGVRYA